MAAAGWGWWQADRVTIRALPGLPFGLPIEPMLAATAATLPEPHALRGGCTYEPKYDGYRTVTFVAADGVRIQSRGGHDITESFPEVAAAVAEQVPAGVVLDAELVIWRGGRLDITALRTRLGARRRAAALATTSPGALMVFDVLAVAGHDVRARPWSERRVLLEAVLADAAPPLHLVPSIADVDVARSWMTDYEQAPALGIEGVVIKGRGDPYQPGRRGWLKHRIRRTHEVLVGATLGTHHRPRRLVLGYYAQADPPQGPRLVVAGMTSQLTSRQQSDVGSLLTAADDQHPWPAEMPPGWHSETRTITVARVQPVLVVEVAADTAFEDGRWRHLVRLVRTRPDRDPETITPPDQQ